MSISILVENLSKSYRLGQIGTGTFAHDLNVWWAKLRGKPNPMLRVGQQDQSNRDGEELWALKDVSFTVEQGEVLGIIGRNGAGKSTLLKILSRVTAPTSGKIKVRGRIASLLEVGTGFHPELTGRENIYLNGAILGMRRDEITRKFDEIVDFAGVEKFIDTPVKRYSSGMYVRLAFAVAAHLDPEILVVDEVLAVGDAEFQKKCLGKMGEVAQGGRTVLFVSHNMTAIRQLCRKVLWIDQGIVKKEHQDVDNVIKDYLTTAPIRSRWENSGEEYDNLWFTPKRVYFCDYKGNPLEMPINKDTDVWVRIEAVIHHIDPSLTIGYAMYDELGTLLFWSYQTDNDVDKWPKLSMGKCSLNGEIPKFLFNEGRYKLELIGGLHNRQWIFKPGDNNPNIYLEFSGGLSTSPFWVHKRPGIFAPTLNWKLAP
jgi:lipopolysaccharide transport system ATP-binding protein